MKIRIIYSIEIEDKDITEEEINRLVSKTIIHGYDEKPVNFFWEMDE